MKYQRNRSAVWTRNLFSRKRVVRCGASVTPSTGLAGRRGSTTSGYCVVPGGGIEPPRPRGLGILSPVRLPVPPPGRAGERYQKTGEFGTREECPPTLELPAETFCRSSYGGLSSVARKSKGLLLRFSSEGGMEAAPGFEPGDKGFAVLCLTTWLCRRPVDYIRRAAPKSTPMLSPGAELRCPGRTRRCPSTAPRWERRTGCLPAGS